MSRAIFTLLYSQEYMPGALVLGATLAEMRPKDSTLALGVLIEKSAFTTRQLENLLLYYSHIIGIDPLELSSLQNLNCCLQRPELAKTLSKILLWGLEFDTILYLDCDTLPSTTCKAPRVTDLLGLEFPTHNIVASPDSGFPDVFNSGVFLLHPNPEDFLNLITLAKLISTDAVSFDGADQGLLNQYFNANPDWVDAKLRGMKYDSKWTRLPFLYNVTLSMEYEYKPAFDYFNGASVDGQASQIKLFHFIGTKKPWQNLQTLTQSEKSWLSAYNKHFGGQEAEKALSLPNPERCQGNILEGIEVKTTKFLGDSTIPSHEEEVAIRNVARPNGIQTNAFGFDQTCQNETPRASNIEPSGPPRLDRQEPPTITRTVEIGPPEKAHASRQIVPVFPWELYGDRPKATRSFDSSDTTAL